MFFKKKKEAEIYHHEMTFDGERQNCIITYDTKGPKFHAPYLYAEYMQRLENVAKNWLKRAQLPTGDGNKFLYRINLNNETVTIIYNCMRKTLNIKGEEVND